METLKLTKLEMHIIAMLYGAYVEENPDDDERSQKHREEIAIKLSTFSNQFYNTDCSILLSAIEESEPIDLASQRTSRAMAKLASETDVTSHDLSNGLEPLEDE